MLIDIEKCKISSEKIERKQMMQCGKTMEEAKLMNLNHKDTNVKPEFNVELRMNEKEK